VCFGSSGGALYGWAGANIDCSQDLLICKVGQSGIHAVGGEECVGFHVDGWDVDCSAELLALFDGAGEFVGSSEDEGCVADSAMEKEPSNQ